MSAGQDVTITCGFAPIAAPCARVLILGSLPSQQSLQRDEYYGNPQNTFWRLMGALFDAGPGLPYQQRIARLTDNGIAVWDVLRSSQRPGSMDANINEDQSVANDFASFFLRQRSLEMVCFNGRKAAQLYAKLVLAELGEDFAALEYETLPSSSPAYAAMNFADKLGIWSRVVAR